MGAHLYAMPGSHPAMAARLMLEAKGVEYKRTDLMPVISRGAVRAVGFPGHTVPALKMDGEKVQGTGEIARFLDAKIPEPRFVPTDPEQLAKVEEIEAFGDVDLQGIARRTTWSALRRDKAPLRSYSEGAKLGIPIGLAVATAAPVIWSGVRLNDADDDHLRADMEALPAALDKVDSAIKDGVIGGKQPNIGDYQVASSLALLMTMDDIRPAIENRPAGKLAKKLVPDFPGHAPPVLPPEYLEPLT
jgi:glutathione S-transferase